MMSLRNGTCVRLGAADVETDRHASANTLTAPVYQNTTCVLCGNGEGHYVCKPCRTSHLDSRCRCSAIPCSLNVWTFSRSLCCQGKCSPLRIAMTHSSIPSSKMLCTQDPSLSCSHRSGRLPRETSSGHDWDIRVSSTPWVLNL